MTALAFEIVDVDKKSKKINGVYTLPGCVLKGQFERGETVCKDTHGLQPYGVSVEIWKGLLAGKEILGATWELTDEGWAIAKGARAGQVIDISYADRTSVEKSIAADPLKKLDEIARRHVAKGYGITFAKAFAKACKENPELYSDYVRKERRRNVKL